MKRNKPLVKRRKVGTQSDRRRKAGYYSWIDWERGTRKWTIVVEQSVVGDARKFSMEGAVPDGDTDNPEDPHWKGVLRWRIDRDGKTFFVYSAPPSDSSDTFVYFRADRKCEKGSSCSLVRYWCTDVNFTLSQHRPSWCPAGVPGSGVWKRYDPDRRPGY